MKTKSWFRRIDESLRLNLLLKQKQAVEISNYVILHYDIRFRFFLFCSNRSAVNSTWNLFRYGEFFHWIRNEQHFLWIKYIIFWGKS